MEDRDVKSLARYYNDKIETASKWIIIIAIAIGTVALIIYSNIVILPLSVIAAFLLKILLHFGAKIWANKKYKDTDPELYREILLDGYDNVAIADVRKKRKSLFNYKHLIILILACTIGPTSAFIKNHIENSMTLKMKNALSTQYKKFKYIDYLDVFQDEKRVDTLCFFKDENGVLSMSSLITFDEKEWYIFLNFGPIYDGFGNIYIDPHYRYMSDIYVCDDEIKIPEDAYLTFEVDGLYIYIQDVIKLSDYESDVWYGAMMTGAYRSYELNTLLTARNILSSNLKEFEILDLGWIRDGWKFADYLCIYSTQENELNSVVFTKDKNNDISGFKALFEDLEFGKTYSYTESRNMYTINYRFYENEAEISKNADYIEKIQVNGRDLWIGAECTEIFNPE